MLTPLRISERRPYSFHAWWMSYKMIHKAVWFVKGF
jgi:hypothetical protein